MVVHQPNSVDQSNGLETTIQYDEIAAYLICRYVSAPEAMKQYGNCQVIKCMNS